MTSFVLARLVLWLLVGVDVNASCRQSELREAVGERRGAAGKGERIPRPVPNCAREDSQLC